MKRVYHVEVYVSNSGQINVAEFDTEAKARGWVRYDRRNGWPASYVRLTKPVKRRKAKAGSK